MFQQYFQRSWLIAGILAVSIATPLMGRTQPTEKPTPTTIENPTGSEKPAQPNPQKSPKAADSFTPKADEVHLLLKLTERRVYVYRGQTLLNKYPVAIGKKGWETPKGNWKVALMLKNPGWTNFKTGQQVAPGPDNPLGERWIGFWTDGKDEIGFHGTTNLSSIGKAASHGCVRMSNKNVKAMFRIVKLGTVVRVRA
jgi:lipoprotein-anchoring transpeptidase ErfK/SrfK